MMMAKASEVDLKMAMDLSSALEAISAKWGATMPEAIARPDGTSDTEYFDPEDFEQCRRIVTYLRELTGSASLMRVVWGMSVLLGPRNKMVDPQTDTLEHHPDTDEAQKDALRLDWMLHRLSGKEMRRIGIETNSGGPAWGRVAIDAAMAGMPAVGAA